jgi:hypothetical protein
MTGGAVLADARAGARAGIDADDTERTEDGFLLPCGAHEHDQRWLDTHRPAVGDRGGLGRRRGGGHVRLLRGAAARDGGQEDEGEQKSHGGETDPRPEKFPRPR